MGIKKPGFRMDIFNYYVKNWSAQKNLVKVKTYKTTNIRIILKINQRSDK